MTKLGFTMTSFVAAIPGAFLCYLLVMVCLNRFNDLTTTLQVVAVSTVCLTLLIALMPLAVIVFFKSAPAKEDETSEEDEVVTDDEDVAEIDDEVEPFEDDNAEPFDDDAFDDNTLDGESAEVDTFESDDGTGEVAEVTDDSEEFDFDSDDDFSFDDD